MGRVPAYLDLLENGELENRAASALARLRECTLCGRQCRANRHAGAQGSVCRTGRVATISSYGAHHGEERCISGWRGSGTIFFAWCNLRCVYCQNWEISQRGRGEETDAERIADIMLALQERGCHNINLVSPSHVIAQILEAVALAARRGLRLPLVYNSGGYDSEDGLRMLDGVVDIYMPDMKYGDSRTARHYSRVDNYAAVNRLAVREMHRQVGDLQLDAAGLAVRGLLVRHLVLPVGLAGSGRIFRFLAEEISTETYLNLMDQYFPSYKSSEYPQLSRRIEAAEFRRALALARKYGLRRLDNGNAAEIRV